MSIEYRFADGQFERLPDAGSRTGSPPVSNLIVSIGDSAASLRQRGHIDNSDCVQSLLLIQSNLASWKPQPARRQCDRR